MKERERKMRKYRIIEEKYEHRTLFYPQYRDEKVDKYVLGQDENGKDITSEYQYLGSWENDCHGDKFWVRDVNSDLPFARHRIEMDMQERKVDELIETIIHEY